MQQFTVPQFLDVEDKIIGPISARQFVELMAGFFIIFILYKILSFTYFVAAAAAVGSATAILAFFKVNGVPFHFFLLNGIQTVRRPWVRVWLKDLTTAEIKALAIQKPEITPTETIELKRPLAVGSLSELSLVVDTGGVYKGESGFNE